jgi:ferritin-like metal-binding protein YciE
LVSVTISRDTNRPTVKEATSMADEKLREKLADYVADAHAMEQSVLRSLDSMISTTDDPEVRSMLEHH